MSLRNKNHKQKNKKRLALIVLLFSFFVNFSQAANIDSLRQIWHSEIDFIARSIQDNSIDYLRGLTQEEWDNGIKEIHKKANAATTNTEYYYALRYFGALINDYHAEFPDGGVYNREKIFSKNDTLFPVWVKSWHDYRVFTVRDFSGNIPKYSEIISVNGISAKNIAFEQRRLMAMEGRMAMAYCSSAHEGEPEISTTFPNYLFCENIKSPFTVEYMYENALYSTTLNGMHRQEIYKIQKKDGNISKQGFAMLFSLGKNTISYNKLNDSIGVLQIKMFLGSGVLRFLFTGTDTGFYKKMAKFMAQIKKDDIKHLIIDLRDNVGGYEYNIYELLACFTDTKFPLVETYRITNITKGEKWISKRLKKEYQRIYGKNNSEVLRSMEIFNAMPVNSYFRSDTLLPMIYTPRYSGEKYTGKTYLLTNAICYSASIIFAQLFQSHKLGLVAGNALGGYTNVTSGDAITIQLPSSKFMPLNIPVTLTSASLPKKYEYLTPDIPIEPAVGEWLYDKFDLFEELVAMIKENKIDSGLIVKMYDDF
ncbi:MAG: S41 family peptidase [Bacteroidales bacterium]|nr:S41 family peptidase [Bacteroidales bacterium]